MGQVPSRDELQAYEPDGLQARDGGPIREGIFLDLLTDNSILAVRDIDGDVVRQQFVLADPDVPAGGVGPAEKVAFDGVNSVYVASTDAVTKVSSDLLTLWLNDFEGGGDFRGIALNRAGTRLYACGSQTEVPKDSGIFFNIFELSTETGSIISKIFIRKLPAFDTGTIADIAVDGNGDVWVLLEGTSGVNPGPVAERVPHKVFKLPPGLGSFALKFSLTDHGSSSTALWGGLVGIDVLLPEIGMPPFGGVLIVGLDDQNGDGAEDVNVWQLRDTGGMATLKWQRFITNLSLSDCSLDTSDGAYVGGAPSFANRNVFKQTQRNGTPIWSRRLSPGTVEGLDADDTFVLVGSARHHKLESAFPGNSVYDKTAPGNEVRDCKIRPNH